MINSTEVTPTRRAPAPGEPRRELGDSCDWCGQPVHRETAARRIERGPDGLEVVLVCLECESGTD